MSVTVAVTTWEGHRHLLPQALASCAGADEVLVIDNGRTCGGIAQEYGARYFGRDADVGSLPLSRNIGIEQASCDWLIWLDADDTLLRVPDDLAGDWCYADLLVTDGSVVIDRWDYSLCPRDRESARSLARTHRTLPVPMKAAFRVEWLRDNALYWRNWPHTFYAEDVLACLTYLDAAPDIHYLAEPFYIYRWTDRAQYDTERVKFQHDLIDYLGGTE